MNNQEDGLNGQNSGCKENRCIRFYDNKESAKDASQERIPVKTDNGTILKPFIIDDGRFVVEVGVTNLENVMFSIRGELNSKKIPDMFRIAENYLEQIINDNEHSDC